jgi:hypothetical protein
MRLLLIFDESEFRWLTDSAGTGSLSSIFSGRLPLDLPAMRVFFQNHKPETATAKLVAP